VIRPHARLSHNGVFDITSQTAKRQLKKFPLIKRLTQQIEPLDAFAGPLTFTCIFTLCPHPLEMGPREFNAFLTWLASKRHVAEAKRFRVKDIAFPVHDGQGFAGVQSPLG
jgi:cytochrome P450